ncbi:hypothetical protein WG901_05685 [Novosphingobium sp. PS1R-30]|uniref:Uncharacterized protein n=1 Tax=Novosphingobium anseongense TaxID=3133436 RepID=A0ABU8RTL9_9SPHN
MRKTATGFAVAISLIGAAPALSKQSEPVKVTSANAIKGTQRVTIGQFTIGFLIERKDSTKAGGGLMGSGFGGRSTVRSTLAGYTQAEMQEIVDAAYGDFVTQLTAAGFEVADRTSLEAHPAMARARGEAGPKEMTTITGRDDKAKVLFIGASQTQPLRLLIGDVAASGFGAMGMIMSGSQAAQGFAAYVKDTDTRVVNVVYYLDFAKSEEYGGWFRNSSAVQVEGGLAMMETQSKLSIIGPNNKTGSLVLNEPVAIGGNFFRKTDAMGSGEKVSNALGNAIGLLGGVGTNSSKKFTFTPEPGAYSAGARQLATEANQVLVSKLATLR